LIGGPVWKKRRLRDIQEKMGKGRSQREKKNQRGYKKSGRDMSRKKKDNSQAKRKGMHRLGGMEKRKSSRRGTKKLVDGTAGQTVGKAQKGTKNSGVVRKGRIKTYGSKAGHRSLGKRGKNPNKNTEVCIESVESNASINRACRGGGKKRWKGRP